MPNELQELQLRVSLINEASEGVSRIRDELKELASGAGKTAMDKLKEEQSELAKQIKELAELSEGGGRALIGYIGKFGVAGAAMGGFAASILVGLGGLKEFADRVVDLTNKAKVIGMHPAELKSLIEQYDRLGVTAGSVEQSMAGLSNVLAQVNRIGSEKRMEMIKAAGQFGTLMEQGIERIEAQASQAGKLQEIIRQSYVVYDERMKETDGNRADAIKSQNDFMRLWELDPVLKVLRHVEEVSEEEKKLMDARSKATGEFKKVVSDLHHEVEELGADLSTSLLGAGGVVVSGLHLMLDLVKELRELWKGTGPSEKKPAGSGAPTRPLTTKDLLGSVLGGGGATFEERWRGAPTAPAKPATEQPAGLMSAPAPGSTVSDQIPGVGKGWEWMRRSENIEDRREVDNGLRQGDDYLKNIEKNTAETKRLNENFKLLDQGDVELKGLGGLPGFSKGAGGAYGGGGATGTYGDGAPVPTAPNGSSVGPGTGKGSGESHPSTGTGGGTKAPPDTPVAPTAPASAGGGKFTDPHGMGPSVQPRLLAAAKAGAAYLPEGYRVEISSGARSGTHVGAGPHLGGRAIDVKIYGPNGYISNRGDDPTGMYQLWAQGAQSWASENDPALVKGTGVGTLGWGGAFDTSAGSGVADPMHLDIMGSRGRHFPEKQLRKLPLLAKPLDDRNVIDAAAKSVRTTTVEVNGKLTADVNAPRGADVKVNGEGAFAKTETNRTMPIEAD
jgi:hypothetical protein